MEFIESLKVLSYGGMGEMTLNDVIQFLEEVERECVRGEEHD